MKNWDYNEEFVKKNPLFAVVKGKLVQCVDISCEECDFGGMNCCSIARIEFLYQDNKELVVLTDNEKTLCKLLGRGWIARDSNGDLWWYEDKITERNSSAWVATGIGLNVKMNRFFPQCKFDFIKWEDEEPWEVKVDD